MKWLSKNLTEAEEIKRGGKNTGVGCHFLLQGIFRIQGLIPSLSQLQADSLPSVVQSLSRAQLFVTPWTIACQTSLSFTISWSLLKFKSIKSLMPPNHLILCHPLLLLPSIFPASGSFLMSGSSHQVAKILELQLQHQSFQ